MPRYSLPPLPHDRSSHTCHLRMTDDSSIQFNTTTFTEPYRRTNLSFHGITCALGVVVVGGGGGCCCWVKLQHYVVASCCVVRWGVWGCWVTLAKWVVLNPSGVRFEGVSCQVLWHWRCSSLACMCYDLCFIVLGSSHVVAHGGCLHVVSTCSLCIGSPCNPFAHVCGNEMRIPYEGALILLHAWPSILNRNEGLSDVVASFVFATVFWALATWYFDHWIELRIILYG
jgi:hypothetical protein